MKPYYEHAGITIYHGDCREILPQLPKVELVLTDPPYGIDGSRGPINESRSKGEYTNAFQDSPAYIRDVVVPVLVELIERCASVIVTPGNRNLCSYPSPDSFGCFYQPAAAGMQVFGNLDAQPIFYYGKNLTKKNLGVPCSMVLTEAPERNGHPCPKPYSAWRTILQRFSVPTCTVLDPFCGSGTTLKAAKDVSLSAIGIEIEEKYCEIAAKRLSQEVFQFEEKTQ